MEIVHGNALRYRRVRAFTYSLFALSHTLPHTIFSHFLFTSFQARIFSVVHPPSHASLRPGAATNSFLYENYMQMTVRAAFYGPVAVVCAVSAQLLLHHASSAIR